MHEGSNIIIFLQYVGHIIKFILIFIENFESYLLISNMKLF